MDCDREGDNLVATRMDTSTGKKTNLTPRRGLPGDGGWVGPVAGLPTRVADGLDVPPPSREQGLKGNAVGYKSHRKQRNHEEINAFEQDRQRT